MTDKPSSIRFASSDLRRADALIGPLSRSAEFAALGRVTRSAVLRLALARGLESLETQFGSSAKRARGRRQR